MKSPDKFIYEKIRRYLHTMIRQGTLKEGDRLMSERDFAKMFKTSNMPVRQAMRSFIDQGVLEKQPGRGTFVKKLPGTSTNKVAVLYCAGRDDFFVSPFYAPVFAGIERQLRTSGKILLLDSLATVLPDTPSAMVARLTDDVDGFILVDPWPPVFEDIRKAPALAAKPVVLVNYETTEQDIDTVVFNCRENTRAITQLLIDQGHTRIGFVYRTTRFYEGPHPNLANRQSGYRDALADNGIPRRPEWEMSSARLRELGLRTLLRGTHGPTAIVCASEMVALAIYAMAKDEGVAIPRDLSVTGYDDTRETADAEPRLTTVHTPLMEMGAAAGKRLLEKLQEREAGITTHCSIVVASRIIERDSHTGPGNAAAPEA